MTIEDVPLLTFRVRSGVPTGAVADTLTPLAAWLASAHSMTIPNGAIYRLAVWVGDLYTAGVAVTLRRCKGELATSIGAASA